MWFRMDPAAPGAPLITLAKESNLTIAYSCHLPSGTSTVKTPSLIFPDRSMASSRLPMGSGARQMETNSGVRRGLTIVTPGSNSLKRWNIEISSGSPAGTSLAYVSSTSALSSLGRLSAPNGHPDPMMRSHRIPSLSASSNTTFSMSIHSSLSHFNGLVSKVSSPAGNSIGLISTPPIPASFMMRSSRTSSFSLTRSPFHHHLTKGR